MTNQKGPVSEIVPKQAYTIPEIIKIAPIGRSMIYELMNAGVLKARKAGDRTIILKEDYEEFLRNLPLYKSGEAE